MLKVALRAQEHIEKLRDAGFDTQRFFDALVGIRDDPLLPKPHREALYRLIANESFIWYLEAIRRQPIDRSKLALEARKLAEEYDAAIRKQAPGERAAELLRKDIAGEPTPQQPKAVPAATAKPTPKPAPQPLPQAKPRPPKK